jgi:hypothetical protein
MGHHFCKKNCFFVNHKTLLGAWHMSDLIWYLYQQEQQLGPFTTSQIVQMHSNSMIAQDAFVFKVGWKDWRPLDEVHDEFGLPNTSHQVAVPQKPSDKRATAPRATIKGRVVVHNNGQLTIGQGVNISATGIFVETSDQIFTVGEMLKLSVRADGIAQPFNVVAQVIRFNSDKRYPVGYGLRFEKIDLPVRDQIQSLVDQQNRSSQQSAVS